MNRDDVINKAFPHSFFGYDPVAVDAFLDEVIREFDRLNNTIDVLNFRLSQELVEAKEVNEVLSGVLLKEGFIRRAAQITAPEEKPEEEAEPEPVPEAEPEAAPTETPADAPDEKPAEEEPEEKPGS